MLVVHHLFQAGGMHIHHKLIIALTVFRLRLTKADLLRINEIPTFIVVVVVGIKPLFAQIAKVVRWHI